MAQQNEWKRPKNYPELVNVTKAPKKWKNDLSYIRGCCIVAMVVPLGKQYPFYSTISRYTDMYIFVRISIMRKCTHTRRQMEASHVQWYKVNIIMLRGSDRDFNVMQIS